MFTDDGEPRDSLLKWLIQFEKRADAMRHRLGLDPLAHAELARQRVEAQRSAVDLDALQARGAELVEATIEPEDDRDAAEAGDA